MIIKFLQNVNISDKITIFKGKEFEAKEDGEFIMIRMEDDSTIKAPKMEIDGVFEIVMKYEKDLYLDSGFYGGDFGYDIENHKEKIVKCRKPHECNGGCDKEIKSGDYVLLETGFMDGAPVSCYTCLPCIEKWLEESGQVDIE